MSCCGGDSGAGSLLKKREALLATPFFSAAATDESSTHLVERVAEEAVLLKVKSGNGLNDPPFGTFVVVVEGELKHTEVRNGSSRKVNSPATVKPGTDDAMATRRKGDLFRVAGIGGSSKLHKMAGNELSRIVAVQRSVVLLIEPDALTRALARTKQDSADGGGRLASILQEMASQEISSLIARVPCFAPLNERLRSTLAQLFSYDILTPKSTLFQEGEKGETLCILLHGVRAARMRARARCSLATAAARSPSPRLRAPRPRPQSIPTLGHTTACSLHPRRFLFPRGDLSALRPRPAAFHAHPAPSSSLCPLPC